MEEVASVFEQPKARISVSWPRFWGLARSAAWKYKGHVSALGGWRTTSPSGSKSGQRANVTG